MRRILVIGSPGAGKSRFARALGARTGLDVVHLDTAYWSPGWREPAHADWEARLDGLLAQPAWILDGNYSRTLARRLRACDGVVLLDLPRWLCLWRVLWRMSCGLGRVRPDMAAGCLERFDPGFLHYVWRWPGAARARVLAQLRDVDASVAVHRLRTRGQVRRFLADAA